MSVPFQVPLLALEKGGANKNSGQIPLCRHLKKEFPFTDNIL